MRVHTTKIRQPIKIQCRAHVIIMGPGCFLIFGLCRRFGLFDLFSHQMGSWCKSHILDNM